MVREERYMRLMEIELLLSWIVMKRGLMRVRLKTLTMIVKNDQFIG
jgi:hypothetical protein